jgi:hypothetical protein
MKKYISITILIITLLISKTLKAQQSYVEGYVVNVQGDTLRGFLKTGNQINSKVVFKEKNNQTQTTTYTPEQLNTFFFKPTDEYYYSKTVNINVKPFGESLNLDNSAKPVFIQKTVFVNLLSKGAINLYMLDRWDDNYHFFVEKNGSEITELLLIKYIINTGEYQGKLVTVEEFKNQLASMLENCPTINARKIDYGETSFTETIQKYNSCVDKTTQQYTKKKEGLNFNIDILGGLSRREFVLNTFQYRLYYGSSSDPSLLSFAPRFSPSLGLSLDVSSKRKNNSLATGLDIIFRSDSYKTNINDRGGYKYEASYVNTAIEINPFVKYIFKRNKIKPYVRVGIIYAFNLKNENSIKITRLFPLSPVLDGEISKGFRNTEIGFLAGIGCNFSKIKAEVLYGNLNKNYSNPFDEIRLTSINLMLGYRIK